MYCERQWWNSKLNLMPCSRKSFLKNTNKKNMQKFGVFLQSATIQEWDFLNVGRFPNGVVSRIGLRCAIYFFKNSIEHSAIPVDGELSIITDRHNTIRWTEGYGSLCWNIFHSEWNESQEKTYYYVKNNRNREKSRPEQRRGREKRLGQLVLPFLCLMFFHDWRRQLVSYFFESMLVDLPIRSFAVFCFASECDVIFSQFCCVFFCCYQMRLLSEWKTRLLM